MILYKVLLLNLDEGLFFDIVELKYTLIPPKLFHSIGEQPLWVLSLVLAISWLNSKQSNLKIKLSTLSYVALNELSFSLTFNI
jgi:hypothetical protein